MFSSDVNVKAVPDDKLWFYIDNQSGFLSQNTTFELQLTTEGTGKEVVGKCVIEGQDNELKAESEWEDSDGSDYSLDDLFDGDEAEHKVKLKWKIKRTAKFYDNEGNEFAKLKVKLKGKTKAEAEYEPNEHGQLEKKNVEVKTKVKKVIYTLEFPEIQEEPLEVEVDNGHWEDWDRVFETALFRADYDAKWGLDVVNLEVKEGAPTVKALLCGFTVAYYFHPSRYVGQMDSHAQSMV